jgi:dTDP-4-dehydrorhamnose reductase
MRILICGAGGQLGDALEAALEEHELVALDHGGLDITLLPVVREALAVCRPDLVINAAAYTNVDGAESEPQAAFEANAIGPRHLALATAELGIPLLQVSTDYVFDGERKRPYHEGDLPAPRSVYGASKLVGEVAVRALNPRHYIVRTAWLYHLHGRNFPRTMLSLAETRSEVRVVNDQHGSPTFAPHLAEAIGRLIRGGAYGIHHLAGRGGTTWFGLTRALFELLDIRTPVIPVTTREFPRPARRPAYSVLTTRRRPEILLPPWEEGIAEFAAALRFHGAGTLVTASAAGITAETGAWRKSRPRPKGRSVPSKVTNEEGTQIAQIPQNDAD